MERAMTEKVYDQREDLHAAGGTSGVKIIKRGQAPEEKTYRSTCRNCLTIVEFKRRDAKFTADQRDGDYLSVDCPVCAHRIYATP